MAAKYKRAGGKQSRNDEHRRRRVLCRHAKPGSKVFVDGVNFVVVVRFDENVADENAREDSAERELQMGEVAERESFAWRAKYVAAVVSAAMSDASTAHHGIRSPPNAKSLRFSSFRTM
jgi:hypothetical protein